MPNNAWNLVTFLLLLANFIMLLLLTLGTHVA